MSDKKLSVFVEACSICDKDRDWREIPDGASCGHDPRKHRELREVEVVAVDSPNVLTKAEADLLAKWATTGYKPTAHILDRLSDWVSKETP